MVPDIRMVTINHPQKLGPRESNGHVTSWVKTRDHITFEALYLRNGAR